MVWWFAFDEKRVSRDAMMGYGEGQRGQVWETDRPPREGVGTAAGRSGTERRRGPTARSTGRGRRGRSTATVRLPDLSPAGLFPPADSTARRAGDRSGGRFW